MDGKRAAALMTVPREIRDTVYDYIIASLKRHIYNDYGMDMLPDIPMLRVCKDIRSEFIVALLGRTGVALKVNLDETEMSDNLDETELSDNLDEIKTPDITTLVRGDIRERTRALVIYVYEYWRYSVRAHDRRNFTRQQVADFVMHAVKAFPLVRDIAVSIILKPIADEKLAGMLKCKLEERPALKEYRIFTHCMPGCFPRFRTEDMANGLITTTHMERTMQWEPRAITDLEWSMTPVSLVYEVPFTMP